MAEQKKIPPINTSGWTLSEIRKLKKLVELEGTDRSKLIRKLVREAELPSPTQEKAIELPEAV